MERDVIVNLIASVIAAALFTYLFIPLRKWVRKHLATPPEAPASTTAAASAPTCPPLPEPLTIPERVIHLERQLKDALQAAEQARIVNASDHAFEEQGTAVHDALHSMAFLRDGDIVDDRFVLQTRIGNGRLSVVWKAYDRQDARQVALKFMRQTFINDASLVKRFHYTADVARDFRGVNFASVYGSVREITIDGTRKLIYVVMEYVQGDTLDVYVAKNPGKRDALLDGLVHLGQCLSDAHVNGLVHRDIKPSNILVRDNGVLSVVDFDSVLRLRDRRVTHHDIGTFGYSAPEVLSGTTDLDVRADIFALGRVCSFLYYGGRDLPNAYEKSVYDVVDLLNCAPTVKDVLERATAVPLSKRYDSMKSFISDLETAVREDREEALPFVDTLRRERDKIYRLLRHSFYGTLALMMIARPAAVALGNLTPLNAAVHLSDRAWVGAFQAVIGSLVWGTFISGAFLLYLVVFHRRVRQPTAAALTAALCCGLGGFAGGLLVSVPSVFVTNASTLACLGWLPDARTPTRLWAAMVETRMMLAFPLVGLLTGLGAGLALYHGIQIALRMSPEGSGVLPIPAKRSPHAPRLSIGVVGRLLRSPAAHLMLATPAILAVTITPAFAIDPFFSMPGCDFRALPLARSVGEGIVHYFGAVGLAAGFFWGMPATPPSSQAARPAR